MIIEYIKPIVGSYEGTLLKASKYLKDLKKSVIMQTIEEVTGKVYKYSEVKDRVDYKYTDVHGKHTFLLDDKELIKFYPSMFKQNETNEIVCSFEYKLLYREGR